MEKIFKKKQQQELEEAIAFLDDTRFNFACFVDHFKRYVDKLKDDRNKEHDSD